MDPMARPSGFLFGFVFGNVVTSDPAVVRTARRI